jgi:hypothetical protein
MTDLNWTVTTDPDLDGFKFYVEAGKTFDREDYAEAYGLNPHELNPRDVHAIQDASARPGPGEWLEVNHNDEQTQ